MLLIRRSLAVALVAALGLVASAQAQAQAPTGQPVNRTVPVVTQSGSTLATTNGTWVGDTRPYGYEWLRCADATPASCIVVPGQTAPTYAITGLDAGARLRARVTASNQLGSRAALSEPTPPVAVSAPVTTGPRALPRLSPFPVLVVTGRTRAARTRITGLLVRGPAGARVAVRCRAACRAKPFTRRIPAGRRTRLKKGELLYRAGAILEIRVTGRAKIGKFTRLRIRRGRAPARLDRCLAPGATAPSACS